MKIAILAAALLLGGSAFLLRGKDVAPPARPATVPEAAMTSLTIAEPIEVPEAEAAMDVRTSPTTAAPAVARASGPKPRVDYSMATLLRGRLGLSDERKKQVMEILDQRAAAAAAYEAEVRARGWFRLEDFERRIGEIRQLSYLRIDATLDAEQREKFQAARVELETKDFISIAIPEEEVVCLD